MWIPGSAKNQGILNNYLKLSTKNDRIPIKLSTETEMAFDTYKKELADATLLTQPRMNTILALTTDASDNALGAALERK